MSTFNPLTGAANPFNGIVMGRGSAASLADIDRDLDRVGGELDRVLSRCRNTATATAPKSCFTGMSRLVVLSAVLALTGASTHTAHAQTISMDFVPVGNVGNAADPLSGFGAVNSFYSIGKYEVTNAQYVGFLNAVDPFGINTRALYNPRMSTDANTAGISFTPGNPFRDKYRVLPGQGDKPVTYVSWYDAARMANWMHNGQRQGSTESGVYTLTGNTSISGERATGARVFIPTENEWYKAAYHQPAAAGGGSDNYWLYPTGGDEIMFGNPPGTGGFLGGRLNGNFFGFNGYAVTQSFQLSSSQNYLTNVGAYPVADSFYGTFDQGGNVEEWNETVIPLPNLTPRRGTRGGSWYSTLADMSSDFRRSYDPASEDSLFGFRLATAVPEPGTWALWLMGVGLLAQRLRRQRCDAP